MAPSSSSPSSSSLQAALERFQRERQAFLRALVDLTKPQVFRGFCSRVRHAPLGGPLPSSFDPPLQRAVKRGQPPRLPSHKRTQHADAMLALGCVAVLRGLLQDDVPRCGGGGGCWLFDETCLFLFFSPLSLFLTVRLRGQRLVHGRPLARRAGRGGGRGRQAGAHRVCARAARSCV